MSVGKLARRALATLSGGASSGPLIAGGTVPWAALALRRLDGEPFDTEALVGKPVLVVNVASKCGFTYQYEGLQELWERFEGQGLVILGVPCNQFGWQEPGGAEDIESFCRLTYGVGFPMLEKQDVNGPERSALYQHLLGSGIGGEKVEWNFEKFLVDREGKVVRRFVSTDKPGSEAVVEAIESVL